MSRTIDIVRLPSFSRRPRHQHRVEQFSRDSGRLARLGGLGVARGSATDLVEAVSSAWSVEPPTTTFHRGRSSHTGYCIAPRLVAVARHGEDAVAAWEAANHPWPACGLLRLGDPTALSTIAHEMGHHLVHALDPHQTPAHGKRWVARFDDVAETIDGIVGSSAPARRS